MNFNDSLTITNVRIVSSSGISDPADIFINDGKITGIHKTGIIHPAGNLINGNGLIAMPGFIDLHFHAGMESIDSIYNDLKVESRAAVAGGYTYIRSHLIIGEDGKSGYLKVIDSIIKNAEKVSYADFSFNPMIGTMEQANEVEELIKKGINAYKIYYNAYQGEEGRNLGIYVDEDIDDIVIKVLSIASKYKKARIIFHAEDNSIVEYCTDNEKEKSGLVAYSRGRPSLAESIKIDHIGQLALNFGAKIHIAHISSIEAYEAVKRYKNKGANITMETEPHYIFYDNSMWETLGVFGKVNPPLRTPRDREFLIKKISERNIDSISSDVNALSSKQKMKNGNKYGNIWDAAPGFDNIQMTLPELITKFVSNGILSYETLAYIMSERPAQVIGAAKKGSISIGKDADIILVDNKNYYKATPELLENVPGLDWNPEINKEFKGWPYKILLDGIEVYSDFKMQENNQGRYVYIK